MNELFNGFEESADISWTSVSQLKAIGQTLHCIDGHQHESVLSAPGGNAGETLLVLAAAESLHKSHYRPRFLRWFIHRCSEILGCFHMHSDEKSIARLLDALEQDPELKDWVSGFHGIHDFFQGLLNPPGRLRSQLVGYLIQPQYTGCGHLRRLLENPQRYAIRKQLVEDTIASFFILLWGKHPKIEFDMLLDNQNQTAFLSIESTGYIQDQTPIPYACHHSTHSLFVNHQPVRQVYQQEAINILSELETAFGRSPLAYKQLSSKIEELGLLHLELTRETLASDLPMLNLKLENGQLHPYIEITESEHTD